MTSLIRWRRRLRLFDLFHEPGEARCCQQSLEEIAATSSALNALAFRRASLDKVIQVDSFPTDGGTGPPHAPMPLPGEWR